MKNTQNDTWGYARTQMIEIVRMRAKYVCTNNTTNSSVNLTKWKLNSTEKLAAF